MVDTGGKEVKHSDHELEPVWSHFSYLFNQSNNAGAIKVLCKIFTFQVLEFLCGYTRVTDTKWHQNEYLNLCRYFKIKFLRSELPLNERDILIQR